MIKLKRGGILGRSTETFTVTNVCSAIGHDKEYGILQHLIVKHSEWHPQVWCSGCDLLFAQKNKKVEHKKLCGNKPKPYECTVPNCGQKYRSKLWLSNHMATKHPEADKDVVHHVCCKCGADLTRKQALKSYENTCNALTPDD